MTVFICNCKNLPKAVAEQKEIVILTNQIESASNEKKDLIITGDANLCSKKWNEQSFGNKKISNQLKDIHSETRILLKHLNSLRD